jgi:hypothetical protein
VLDALTADDFAPHIGTAFRLVAEEDDARELTLTDLTRFPPQPGAPRAESFSLVFSGARGESPLQQRIHALEHPQVGHLELFLVPLGPGPDGAPRYEAVFN